jgi:hypothetical protein
VLMLGLGSEIGFSALRLWVAAGAAAFAVVFFALALFRPQSAGRLVLRAGLLAVGAALGAAMTWTVLNGAAFRDDRGAERRALELGAEELSVRALAPGSPLACLDAFAGESVEAACEKALFVSPASVASASSYVAARLMLLSAMVRYAERGGADIDHALLPLRRSLEADRFGFLAHVLEIRDGCTSQNCKALSVLRDASRVRTNLSAQTLDRYLDHYQELWAKTPDGTPAEGAQSNAGAQSNTQGTHKLVNIDFPTAASIPAVSIMNPEPTGPVLPGVAAAAAANPNPQQTATLPSRRSRKQAATPSTQAQTMTQPAASSSAAIEPIWPEPVPPPPQTNAVPAGAPVQLNPSSPSANAGQTARAQ